MSAILTSNHHGKGRVRIVKVVRKGKKHCLMQFTVEIILHGPMDEAFLEGDNSIVIPTDTQKNTVYVVAKINSFDGPEEFSILLAEHFIATYPKLVSKCVITVKQDIWKRVECPSHNGIKMEHNHAFIKVGPHYNYARAEYTQTTNGVSCKLWGGCKGLTLLKTTQSSFVNFHKDEYTTLPEASDRLVGSNFDSEWMYSDRVANKSQKVDFNAIRDLLMTTLTEKFVGPADTGVMSVSVQATAFQMGSAVINRVPFVESITLYMPNVHNMPFDLTRFGLENMDQTGNIDIFYPIDEPHGIIQATISRPISKL